jgi:hypothetical protein
MAKVLAERMAAEIDGDFVVFLISFRPNKLWKVHKWLPVFLAMPGMLRELYANPDSGFLGHQGGMTLVQYWRSFDHLEAYARSRNHKHWPAWVAFNKRLNKSRGDVGIWHETYRVRAGEYETIYSGMPPHGLGKASRLVPAAGTWQSARGRLQPRSATIEATTSNETSAPNPN